MELRSTGGIYSVTATTSENGFTLHCFANGELVAEREIQGEITGMVIDRETLYCTIEYDVQAEYKNGEILLHSFKTHIAKLQTFNMKLEEISSTLEAEEQYGRLLSCMDKSSVYTLHWDTGSTKIDNISYDEIVSLVFKRHDFNCRVVEWTLDDFKNDNECSEMLEAVTSGYVTKINRVFASGGKLLFDCDVFDPSSVIEMDDPEFDENELSDSDYVEFHSFPCTICADLDKKELSYVIPDETTS